MKNKITRAKFLINTGKTLGGLFGVIIADNHVEATLERESASDPVDQISERLEPPVKKNLQKKKIALLKTHIAGAYYYDAIKSVEFMKKGDRLILCREPGNTHDKNAIAIYWKNTKAGYVPKVDNKVLAKIMDQGLRVNAKIIEIQTDDIDWHTIYFEAGMRAGA